MSTAIEELLTACLHRVFGERDEEKRISAIAEILAEDIVFSDPDGIFRGHQAVNERVRSLLEGAPGFVFSEAGPVREVRDLGVLEWGFGPEGQLPVVTGMDVVTVVDGRIATLHTLLIS